MPTTPDPWPPSAQPDIQPDRAKTPEPCPGLWRRDGYFAWNWRFGRISPQTGGIDDKGEREFLWGDQGAESLASLGEPMGILPPHPRDCLRDPSNNDKVYFFAEDRYWRYDLGKDYGEVKYPLPLNLWHLARKFASGIGATLDGVGRLAGKAYFFKDDQYVRYDRSADKVDQVPKPISAWNLGAGFMDQLSACCNTSATVPVFGHPIPTS